MEGEDMETMKNEQVSRTKSGRVYKPTEKASKAYGDGSNRNGL